MANPIRENMTRQAVANATFKHLPITVENVRRFLPGPSADQHLKGAGGVLLHTMPDFELDAADLAPWTNKPEPVSHKPEAIGSATGKVADEVLKRFAADADQSEAPEGLTVTIDEPSGGNVSDIQDTIPPAADTPQARFARAEQTRLKLEQERAELRGELDAAIRAEIAARNERDRQAHAFTAGLGPSMTQEQLIREHIASEQVTRQAIKEGRLPARRRSTTGPSMVDKYAAAQRGGNPAFAGRGYARGGQPVSKRQMPWANTPQAPGQPGGPKLAGG